MRTLVACFLLLAAGVPAWGTDLPAFPFINVTGVATREVAPDLAKVSFTVTARDASFEVAANTVATQTQAALDLLTAAGIDSADIDAHGVAKQVVFDRESGGISSGPRRPGTPRFDVSRSIAVLVRKVASWPDLATKLLEMPNVEDLEAHFDRTDRKALEAELLAEAAHDAERRAGLMAGGFGQHLGAVQAVSQDPFEQISDRFLRADMRYAYAGSPTLGVSGGMRRVSAQQVLVPATIPLGTSINAIYRLEGAAH
jgi:uncharacterized protein YggE